MFTLHVSYLSILQVVAHHCGVSSVLPLHEIADDGTHLFPIELELLSSLPAERPARFIFWGNALPGFPSYELAALEALMFLQNLYGFVVLDYSVHGLLLYRRLGQHLLPIANRGVQLARLVMSILPRQDPVNLPILTFAEQVMREVVNMSNIS
jgi:hypothetical protein